MSEMMNFESKLKRSIWSIQDENCQQVKHWSWSVYIGWRYLLNDSVQNQMTRLVQIWAGAKISSRKWLQIIWQCRGIWITATTLQSPLQKSSKSVHKGREES